MSKLLVMLAKGFEEVEALTVVDYLRRSGLEVVMVSITDDKLIQGSHGIKVMADLTMDELRDVSNYRGIIIPGGMGGAAALRDNSTVIELVQEFFKQNKLIAAICAGPIVLGKAGILSNKSATCYPGFGSQLGAGKLKEDIVVKDGNIITSRGPATTVYFALKIIEHLQGEDRKREIKKAILLDIVEDQI